jgi:hypothetical protein
VQGKIARTYAGAFSDGKPSETTRGPDANQPLTLPFSVAMWMYRVVRAVMR